MSDQPEDSNFIAKQVEALKESISFFSEDGREARERWVAEQFLSYVRPETVPTDIQWVAAEPWDVLVLGAKCQIKEILDPGRKRHKEFKDALVKAESSTDPLDLLSEYSPTTISLSDAVDLVQKKAVEWAACYAPAVVQDMDLLFYLNVLPSVIGNDLPKCEYPDSMKKWRSVSVVGNGYAFVLFAREDSQEYISKSEGRVCRKGI